MSCKYTVPNPTIVRKLQEMINIYGWDAVMNSFPPKKVLNRVDVKDTAPILNPDNSNYSSNYNGSNDNSNDNENSNESTPVISVDLKNKNKIKSRLDELIISV